MDAILQGQWKYWKGKGNTPAGAYPARRMRMKYLRVTKNIYNVPSPLLSLVKDELFTEKEVQKYKLNREYLKPATVSKKNVYFFFGARFEGE